MVFGFGLLSFWLKELLNGGLAGMGKFPKEWHGSTTYPPGIGSASVPPLSNIDLYHTLYRTCPSMLMEDIRAPKELDRDN